MSDTNASVPEHCNATVPTMGKYGLCTRPIGHFGAHRCKAFDVDKRKAESHADEIDNALAWRTRAITEHDVLIRLLALSSVYNGNFDWESLSPETQAEIHRLADAEIERVSG